MRIIKESQLIVNVSYSLEFSLKNMPGCGYGFPCDELGIVAPLMPQGLINYNHCLNGVNDQGEVIESKGIRKFTNRYLEHAIGKCNCGHKVELSSFTNTCDRCGSDYNQSGQLLASRSQWGEETGEHLSDILRIK